MHQTKFYNTDSYDLHIGTTQQFRRFPNAMTQFKFIDYKVRRWNELGIRELMIPSFRFFLYTDSRINIDDNRCAWFDRASTTQKQQHITSILKQQLAENTRAYKNIVKSIIYSTIKIVLLLFYHSHECERTNARCYLLLF